MERKYLSVAYVENFQETEKIYTEAKTETSGYDIVKRIFDLTVTSILLLFLSPLMISVAFLIKLFSKGPVFYTQTRVGYEGKTFQMLKFRSMRLNSDDKIHREFTKNWIANNEKAVLQDGDVKVHKIVKDPRVIPFIGQFIRKFSVDELPQLFNVIRGEMSLIGPRPSLPYEVENYKEWHKERFNALPGITGLWQVSGRNRLSFDEMVKLDIRYIKECSLKLDLIITVKTPMVILFDKAY